ncbi:hypothetical protein HG531_009845 [Fusarium graminearum]|nr:hypothetical protein HG531_009845 [Fusarium graminearum]
MPLLPRINPDAAATPQSKRATLKAFLRKWLKVNYQDLLCMAFVGALAYGIYHSPVIITRTFPITFDATSGDIVYPQWAYPDRGWIIPAWLSGLISIAIPIITYIVAQIQIKSVWDASNAIIGTVWSVTLASLFQVTLKQLVGGFRPYFLDVCMPDISLAKTHNKTGLNGVGFYQIMYTTEICTQPDQSRIQNAITSFPSGHTTAAFAGFGFLFLWLNAKLKVWADHKPAFWKLSLTFVPVLAAVLIAGSLTIDAAHNWYDILGGGFIGTIMAFASYRSTYASVWDWRFNHLPLQETESFRYGFDGDLDYAAQTLSLAAGWGGKKVRLPESSSGPAISTESTLRSGAEEIENLDANTRRKRRGPARAKKKPKFKPNPLDVLPTEIPNLLLLHNLIPGKVFHTMDSGRRRNYEHRGLFTLLSRIFIAVLFRLFRVTNLGLFSTHGPSDIAKQDLLCRDTALIIEYGIGITSGNDNSAINLKACPQTTTLHITPHRSSRSLAEGSVDTGSCSNRTNSNGAFCAERYTRLGKGGDLLGGVEDADAVVNIKPKDKACTEGAHNE